MLDGVAPALEAWANLEEPFDDSAGAEVHRALANVVESAASRGVLEAFELRARELCMLRRGGQYPVRDEVGEGFDEEDVPVLTLLSLRDLAVWVQSSC